MHVESVTSIESLKSETGCFDSSNNGTATLVFLLEKEHFRRVSCDAMLNLLRESFIFSLLLQTWVFAPSTYTIFPSQFMRKKLHCFMFGYNNPGALKLDPQQAEPLLRQNSWTTTLPKVATLARALLYTFKFKFTKVWNCSPTFLLLCNL